MGTDNMKIVAIDDSEESLMALQFLISKRLPDAILLTAMDGLHGLELAKSENPDVMIVDILMPGMDGYEVCRKLKVDEAMNLIPILFMTGIKTDKNSRIKALESGAEGFLIKPFDEIELVAQIRAMYKIKEAKSRQRMETKELASLVAERTWELEKELAERKLIDEALAESETRYRTLADSGQALIWTSGTDKLCNYFNKTWLNYTGHTLEQELGNGWTEGIHPEDFERCLRIYDTAFDIREKFSMEYRLLHHTGEYRWIQDDGTPCYDSKGNFTGYIGHCLDITERKKEEKDREKLQDQLAQAQKMESVGRLAGGVAHDFNNMLSVILGYTEMALNQISPDQPLYAELKEIQKATERSANLTQQLLAFARKQTINPRVLDLNSTVGSMLKMIKRLIGEDIDLGWKAERIIWPIRVDPNQIDQILANLCVNARDAITGTGKVTIETENVVFDEYYCASHGDVIPGEFVLLAVSDNGCGMDKETMTRLFEPFYTTKDMGKGTGLGLATIYGIVKQNYGFINVYSEPGKGTTFKIYFPRHIGVIEEDQSVTSKEILVSQGNETILLVEDEPAIMQMGKIMLEKLGYQVLTASTPDKAIDLAQNNDNEIHLLVTDLVMPEMNGRELSNRLHDLFPGIKTLFMSGYTANVIAHHGMLDKGVNFIPKPFTLKTLAEKVKEAIER